MHRFIMGDPAGMEVDHINRDATLDDREENLRIATHTQNGYNQGMRITNASGFKGVSWDKERSKWLAQIRINGKKIYLGRFNSLEAAAQAYNEPALKYHKQFAYQNDLSQVTMTESAA
jgi:hypothetical protein